MLLMSWFFSYFVSQRRWPYLAGLLFAAASAAACNGEPTPEAAGAPPPPVPVELITLEEKPLDRVDEFVGTLKSLRSTTVQPQAEGFLTRILVKSGMRVSPGAPLFEIDATTQAAAVASLEAQRAAREAEVDFARQQAERAKALLDAGAMSQQELEQAITQRRNADAQLKSIDDQIRQQRAELAYYRVTAQTAGMIGDVPVRVGERVTRSTMLTTIEDSSGGLEVYVSVPVQQAPRLQIGIPIRLVSDTGAVVTESRASFVAPSVDEATQTVLVKAPIDAKAALRPDQFVRARIVWSTQPALTIPVIAVQRISNQFFVFVAEPGEGGKGLVARQRPVSLGPVVGNAYEVREGLKAGDRLIVGGAQKVGEGAPVQAIGSGRGGA
jgi:RND family efflux transporter MFP subunit